MGYFTPVPQLIQTAEFNAWFSNQRDSMTKKRILARITRLQDGNPGDVKDVGEGVSEMRLDFGPGYRLYFLGRGPLLVILLCGGTKKTQDADIKLAKTLAKHWRG